MTDDKPLEDVHGRKILYTDWPNPAQAQQIWQGLAVLEKDAVLTEQEAE